MTGKGEAIPPYVRAILPGRKSPSWVREDLLVEKKARIVAPVQEMTYEELQAYLKHKRIGSDVFLAPPDKWKEKPTLALGMGAYVWPNDHPEHHKIFIRYMDEGHSVYGTCVVLVHESIHLLLQDKLSEDISAQFDNVDNNVNGYKVAG